MDDHGELSIDLPEGSIIDGIGDEYENEYACFPVLCVSASKSCDPSKHREIHSWTYIQGAGDDEENWSRGLTPLLFWQNSDFILQASVEEECIDRISHILSRERTRLESPKEITQMSDLAELHQIENLGIFVALSPRGGTTIALKEPSQVLVLQIGEESNKVRIVDDTCDWKQESKNQSFLHVCLDRGKKNHSRNQWQEVVLPCVLRAFITKSVRDLYCPNDLLLLFDELECAVIVLSLILLFVECKSEIIELVQECISLQDCQSIDFTIFVQDLCHIARRVGCLVDKSRIRQAITSAQSYFPNSRIIRRLQQEVTTFLWSKRGN